MTESNDDRLTDDRKVTKQARTWAQIARLASEALTAIDSGKVKDARAIVTAIRGVAANADRETR